MSKAYNHLENKENNIFNKSNISTPRRLKQKIQVDSSLDSNSLSIELNNKNNNAIIKKKDSSIINQESIVKTPKEILASILENTLGKSLLKMESRTKEQSSTLKFIGKYYIVFEKNLLSLKSGVEKKRRDDEKKRKEEEKKRKEEEKKKKLSRKMKISSTPNRRSKTVQNIRKLTREDSIMSTDRNKNKNNIKQNSGYFKKKKDVLAETPKIRSRTVKSSRYNTTGLRSKNSKEINNARIENTPKRNDINGYKTLNTISRTSIKNENSKETDSNRNTIRDKYNPLKTNNNSNNNNNREPLRSRSRKNTLNRKRDDDKKIRKNSLRRNSKKIKIDGDNSKKVINNTNISTEKNNSPKLSKKGSKINIIEKKNSNKELDLDTNENININEIINNKKEKDRKNNFKEKELNKINPNLLIEQARSKSKNKDKNDKEIEGSLHDVQLMIEGVSGVLNKIQSEKKIKPEKSKEKIEKKKNIDYDKKKIEQIDKEVNELFKSDENILKNKEKEDEKININNSNENIFKNNINIKQQIIKEDEKVEENKNINKDNNLIKSSLFQKNAKENENKKLNEYKFPLKESIKFGKESQIMNEEIIKTIENDQNILTNNSILEGNILNTDDILENKNDAIPIKEQDDLKTQIKLENKNDNDNEVNLNENNTNNNNIIQNKKEEKENENEINNEINNDINNEINKDINNDNLIKKIEEKLEEKEKKLNEENKEVIQIDTSIINDEPLKEPNQSMNQSSFINQSSIINQSAILAEQYVLITKDPNEPFSIENALKFDKNQYLCVLDFLNFQEKIQFTGINRGFIIERIYLLNNKREEMIRSLELAPRENIDDLIMKTRLNYSNDELSKKFNEFQIPRGGAKAVELLNNELYSKLFKKPILEKNSEEICTVYRVLFALFGEYDIANIYGDQLFWIKCTEYMIKNSNGKIGTFILEKFKDITFDHKKIFLLNKLLVGMKKKINPNYFSKICGTTGLLIFLIKDTLEYCGVIVNEKKTQPSRILDNLMYYKKTIDNLALVIDYLSGIKTYKVREKKEKEKDNK